MRIAEVTRLDELTRPDDRTEAEELLFNAGFHALGSGMFASVYGRPDAPFVVKLFDANDSYRFYLNLIMKESNPHFPVIKGRPIQISDWYWGVRLERLEPIEGFNLQLAKAAKQYIIAFLEIRDTETWDYSNIMDPIPSLKPEKLKANAADRTMNRRNMAVFEQNFPELADALRKIVLKVLIPTNSDGDLHVGNFMQRGTTLVITDPISWHDAEELPTKFPQRVVKQGELPLGKELGYQPNYMRLSDKLPAGIKTNNEPNFGTIRQPSLRLLHPDNT